MTLSRDELDEFAKSMARAGGRDSQHVGRSTSSLAPPRRTGSRLQAHRKLGCSCEYPPALLKFFCRGFPRGG